MGAAAVATRLEVTDWIELDNTIIHFLILFIILLLVICFVGLISAFGFTISGKKVKNNKAITNKIQVMGFEPKSPPKLNFDNDIF